VKLAVEHSDGYIRLNGPLDFSTVAELLDSGMDWPSEGDIHIDLAGIGHSNSAGLALLLEWLQKAQQKGRQIKYHNVPEQLLGIARAYGIDRDLPLV
jgi:phospholipid transport system transporter-binding protein